MHTQIHDQFSSWYKNSLQEGPVSGLSVLALYNISVGSSYKRNKNSSGYKPTPILHEKLNQFVDFRLRYSLKTSFWH